MMVVSRVNARGAVSRLSQDAAGAQILLEETLPPGLLLSVRDLEIYHTVTTMQPEDPRFPTERFVAIICARPLDPLQNQMLHRHFPGADIRAGQRLTR